jgi:hypothetical protein
MGWRAVGEGVDVLIGVGRGIGVGGRGMRGMDTVY